MKKVECLLVLLLLLGLTACSNKTKDNQIIEEETVDSRGVVDDFSTQLTLNGKKIKVPTTLNQLGSEYTFDAAPFIDFVNDDGIQCTLGTLNYNGEEYSEIVLFDTVNKDKSRDSVIYSFVLRRKAKDTYSLNSIKRGSSKEDVKKILGEPNKEDEIVLQYFNKKDPANDERVVFQVDDDNKLITLIIGKYPNYYIKD